MLRNCYKIEVMNEEQRDLLLSSSSRFPPPQGRFPIFTIFFFLLQLLLLFKKILSLHVYCVFFVLLGVRLSYGTAGFREDASVLLSTVCRVGILAALRALKTGGVIGLMITASHNKVSDNGVKIADPSGGMLTQEWEPFAEALANASSSQELVRV